MKFKFPKFPHNCLMIPKLSSKRNDVRWDLRCLFYFCLKLYLLATSDIKSGSNVVKMTADAA